MTRDTLFSAPLSEIGAFSFDAKVANVFADMIQRSVPGYQSVIEMTGLFASHFHRPNSCCYDLGSSLGASSLAMLQRVSNSETDDPTIVAVDNSSAMIEKCRTTLADLDIDLSKIEFRCEDILESKISNASFIALNYTLQFIPLEEREAFLSRLYQGLNAGGALIVSEKICFEDEEMQQLMTSLHHDFKESQGYSRLEISQKRTAIENVLIPETLNSHIERLEKAGFKSISPWFQCLNFCSILAIK